MAFGTKPGLSLGAHHCSYPPGNCALGDAQNTGISLWGLPRKTLVWERRCAEGSHVLHYPLVPSTPHRAVTAFIIHTTYLLQVLISREDPAHPVQGRHRWGPLHSVIHSVLTATLRCRGYYRNEEIGVYRPQYQGLITFPEKSLFVSGLDLPCCSWGFPLALTFRGSLGGPVPRPSPGGEDHLKPPHR